MCITVNEYERPKIVQRKNVAEDENRKLPNKCALHTKNARQSCPTDNVTATASRATLLR